MPKSIRRTGHQVFETRPGDGQGTHETSKERDTKNEQESHNKGWHCTTSTYTNTTSCTTSFAAYRISGLAELFPQHYQVPNLSPNAHFKALTEELQTTMVTAPGTTNGRPKTIKTILAPQNKEEQTVATEDIIASPQREDAHIWTIPRISDAPAIMQTRDPMAKRNLIITACIHRRQTRNNTPGALPKITRDEPALIQPEPSPTTTKMRQSTRYGTTHHPQLSSHRIE